MELYHFPADIEQWIAERAGGGAEDELAVAQAVRSLSDAFVGREPWRANYAANPELRRAYLRYYVPVNLPKVRLPLAAWLAADPRRFADRPLRCVDLGSGPGTALLGLCDFLRGLPPADRPTRLQAVALDQSYENLKDAEALLGRFSSADRALEVEFRPLRLDLVANASEIFPLAAAGGRFDLVIAANVLCEVIRDSAHGHADAEALIVAAADQLLGPGGAILIVEPGLRDTARDLHRLRDRLVGVSGLHALAPCLHDDPCPALFTDRDWCIADLPWEPPAIVRDIDRHTGLRKASLKFAYLLLARSPAPPAPGTRWRVVSDVLELKGERRVYLCAAGRWIVLGQLTRERSDAGEALSRIRRGDLVEVEGMEPRGAMFRLTPDATIRRIEG